MPNRPYLDASVQWRIKAGQLALEEVGYRSTVEGILSSGLATEVVGLISSGKEADVYLARYGGAPIAVKVYRLYRTSHRGGGPVKQDFMGWRAAHEFEMTHLAWKGGVRVPTPARRVENMFPMRYLGDGDGPAPRLHDVELEDPERVLREVLEGVESLARTGVVHSDLSAFNVLVYSGYPWFIDFSEALRVDRHGLAPWKRLCEAESALLGGLRALQTHFRRYGLQVPIQSVATRILSYLGSPDNDK